MPFTQESIKKLMNRANMCDVCGKHEKVFNRDGQGICIDCNKQYMNRIYANKTIFEKEPEEKFPDDWFPITWRGSMNNVQIVVTDNFTITVIADTKRFGEHKIMFEGRTFLEACDYIRRTTGKDHFQLNGLAICRKFTDPDGNTLPWITDVTF